MSFTVKTSGSHHKLDGKRMLAVVEQSPYERHTLRERDTVLDIVRFRLRELIYSIKASFDRVMKRG